MSGSLNWWRLRELRKIGWRLLHASSLPAAEAILAELTGQGAIETPALPPGTETVIHHEDTKGAEDRPSRNGRALSERRLAAERADDASRPSCLRGEREPTEKEPPSVAPARAALAKLGTAPPPPASPAPPALAPAVDLKRAAEEDAITRFLTEKGVTKAPAAYCAPSPQGALDEELARSVLAAFQPQHRVTLPDVCKYLTRNGGRVAWSNGRAFKLDGKPCTRGDLYRAANEVRAAAGLLPFRLPSAADLTA
jgi:hypothetical protein